MLENAATFRLAHIFFGGDSLTQRWKFFVTIGLLAGLFGIVLLIDLLDGVADITAGALGTALLLQGIFELVAGTSHTRLRRRLQMPRGIKGGAPGYGRLLAQACRVP